MSVADAALDLNGGEEYAATEYGYYLGQCARPDIDMPLYASYEQALRVIGPMGSGKTFRFLARVVRDAPGAGLYSSSKPELYLWTAKKAARRGPVVTLDPQAVVPGQEPLRWAAVHGAEDTHVAELRARAFVAGARRATQSSDEGASFYRDQAATVLMCLMHAAALDGAPWSQVLRWAARYTDPTPRSILEQHPGAGPGWAENLDTALTGDERKVGNTLSTLQRALACFAHQDVIDSVDDDPDRATDIESLIDANGSIYLLGKDHPFSTVSPLMTAIAEDILDRVEKMAYLKPTRRLDPPFLLGLDEAANVPLPSLPQRVSDGRGRGICTIYALQAWAQAVSRFGRDEAEELAGMTNNVLVFGGVKDPPFLEQMEALCGKHDVLRTSTSSPSRRGEAPSKSVQPDREPIMPSYKIGRLEQEKGEALLLSGTLPPVITHLPKLSKSDEWPQIEKEVEEIVRVADAAAAKLSADKRRLWEKHRAAWRELQGTGVSMDKDGD